MRKRLIAFAMCIILLASLVPVSAQTLSWLSAGSYSYTFRDGGSSAGVDEAELAEVSVIGTRRYSEVEYGFDGINDMRAEKGLQPLVFSYDLSELAMKRAEELALYYSDSRPDGSGFETVFGKYEAGTKVGESHAFTEETDEAMLWHKCFSLIKTDSPENILNSSFTRMGVGIFQTDNGSFYVQLFDNSTADDGDSVAVSGSVKIKKSLLAPRIIASGSDELLIGSSETLDLVHYNAETGLSVKLFPCAIYSDNNSVDVSLDDSGSVVITGISEADVELVISAYDGQDEPCTIARHVTSHRHDYKAVVTPATCTHNGYTTYTCACGKSYVDDYTSASHNVVTANAREATNTESGYTGDRVCSVCGTIFELGKSIPPLSHRHDYKAQTVNVSCIADGGTLYTCSCGDSYMKVSEVSPGHSMKNGLCTVCGYGVSPDNNSDAFISDNNGDQNYYGNYAEVIGSYLYADDDGSIYRVEDTGSSIIAEKYNSALNFISSVSLPYALDIFGGFYSGEEYNYLVFGQENDNEDSSVEIVRVVKYSKSWQELDHLSIAGDYNTTLPFRGGSLRMTENNGILHIHTCHQMYTSADGLRHQANMQIRVNTADMTLNSIGTRVSNSASGYVSHSFNQFIINDNGAIVTCDHGDAYPRAIMLFRYSDGRRANVFSIYGSLGENYTGVQVGGFEASSSHYIVVGKSIEQVEDNDGSSNIFITATDKSSMSSTTLHRLTSYTCDDRVSIGNPQLVKLDDDRLLMLWTEDSSLKYVLLNADGNPASKIYSACGMLSDCHPIVKDGRVIWYVSAESTPYFFILDPDAPERIALTHNGIYGDDSNEYIRVSGGLGGDCTWELSMSGKLTIRGKGALLSPCVTYIGSGGIEPPWYEHRSYVHEIVIENGLEEICDGMFYRCLNLERVTIPWTVKRIGEFAFYDCAELSSVQYMGDAEQWNSVGRFAENGLEDVDISFHEHEFEQLDTAAPDCVHAGYTNYLCSACEYQKQSDIVPALGHDYKSGICTRCGAEKPTISFSDVPSAAYYATPVAWAVKMDITGGYPDNTFRPMNTCTRAQIVTFIWRAMGSPEPAGTAKGFTDVKEGTYYYKAVLWAAEQSITGGFDDGSFHPDELVTRAQAMTFLWRAEGKPAVPEGTENTFVDVPETAYYHDAVLWAVANGVTGGYDSRHFGSMDGCTRAQIVTFLYRDMAK